MRSARCASDDRGVPRSRLPDEVPEVQAVDASEADESLPSDPAADPVRGDLHGLSA